ncbi:uncharacterized protein LOC110412628 [Herrania umbratica]|uniref:Uncharacterized protein LOC110412628 n=1 Tax=Herrania umbratica TaxID=108875 RepID=A0A6J0ZW35_9ROSI|nr:uncharacterized protein LOC110412628 [Herrania umbratica]
MATASTTPQRKKDRNLPPRRGQVKAQIFESVAKTVVSAASKAKQALGKNKGEGSDGKSTSSTTTTPPQSGYNSEGNGDIS